MVVKFNLKEEIGKAILFVILNYLDKIKGDKGLYIKNKCSKYSNLLNFFLLFLNLLSITYIYNAYKSIKY